MKPEEMKEKDRLMIERTNQARDCEGRTPEWITAGGTVEQIFSRKPTKRAPECWILWLTIDTLAGDRANSVYTPFTMALRYWPDSGRWTDNISYIDEFTVTRA